MSLLVDTHESACKIDLRHSFYQSPFDIYWRLLVLLFLLVYTVFIIKMFFLIRQQLI